MALPALSKFAMNQHNCLMTLSLPSALEEEVLDFLQANPQWITGFSVMRAEGFGSGSRLRSTLEQVRGRAQRVMIQTVMTDADCAPLTQALFAQFPSKEIAWWTTPISGFGRLV
jgi:hypothetical protein